MGLSWQQGSAIARSNRSVPRSRTAAREATVCRTAPSTHARAFLAKPGSPIASTSFCSSSPTAVAYFPETDIIPGALQLSERTTRHRDLGFTSWYTIRAGEQSAPRAAWRHSEPPAYASELRTRVAFAWPAIDAFYEEDERIMGHAADSYHRIDIRQSSRNLVVSHRDRIVADTKRPMVLYESGFAPRWYVPRADIDQSALTFVEHQTFCPYKGLCNYYDISDARLGAWSYPEAFSEVSRISGLVSFEPDIVSVQLDGTQLHREPGQTVIAHGPDRELTVAEARARR
jgi:uncharacterized protein (DUF427 family)